MPICIPQSLPAASALEAENIFVMDINRAESQDIRPLKILVLNLMPTKIATETQLARLLGNTPLQIEMQLLAVSHIPKNTGQDHMLSFYQHFDDIRDNFYDGMIITGAPVELLPYEEIDYWKELEEIMEWSKSHVYSTLHICWGAQAGLYYHYGINKRILPEKMSGVFRHQVSHKGSILFRGFDDTFMVPHSRNTAIDEEAVRKIPALKVLAESKEAGIYAISNHGGRQIFIMGHSEYDPLTLDSEYRRDLKAGIHPKIPVNYYPDDDPEKSPVCSWRSSANLLFSNWLNYFVYQATPYDLQSMPPYNFSDPS